MTAQLCLGILFICGAAANGVFAPGPSFMITFALAGVGIVFLLNARRKKSAGRINKST